MESVEVEKYSLEDLAVKLIDIFKQDITDVEIKRDKVLEVLKQYDIEGGDYL